MYKVFKIGVLVNSILFDMCHVEWVATRDVGIIDSTKKAVQKTEPLGTTTTLEVEILLN